MGIIIRQSIRGSVWSYMGVLVGFITTAYLYPEYLSTDTIGLFQLLLAWSMLFAHFSALGFTGVTARLFPYFRDKEKGHNGFLFIAFLVMGVGFTLFLLTYFIFSPWLEENNAEKSQLFSQYIYLLIPLTFFILLFNILDSFNKLLFNVVLGTFLNELLQRLLIMLVVVLYIAGIIDLHQLIHSFAGVISLKGIFMFFYLLYKKEINLKPKPGYVDKKLRREMWDVALFSILAAAGGNMVFSIDKILINQILGLSATGIYSIAFFFGTLVIIPSRPLLRITGTLIAEAWKKNDVTYIEDVYKRSCINQFIIGAFLFGGIWINIDNIIIILGPEYEQARWVIFFIGLGYLIDMATGANDLVIGYSKYYRMSLWFLLGLVIMVIPLMYLFIPLWGITGAAVAIVIALFFYNLMRFLFLLKKFRMQPFSNRFLVLILIFLVAYAVAVSLPAAQLIIDILVRSTVFTILFILPVILFKISPDINKMYVQFYHGFKSKIK